MAGLNFEDCWGGETRAYVSGGFYAITPMGSGYEARKAVGEEWVWDGGLFATNAEAEKACLEFEKGGSQ